MPDRAASSTSKPAAGDPPTYVEVAVPLPLPEPLVYEVPAAFAAVLLFRFVTFWLPLLPGWLALRGLRGSGRL